MKTVLLAFDGSESALHALHHVLRMPAPQRPQQIHVLNVQESPMYHGQIVTHDDVHRMREAQLAQGRHILRPAEEALQSAGAAFKSHVVLGEPEHVIVEMAGQLECDHIVIGSRGMGTIKTLLLGSIAMKTVHLAQVPVTLVK